MKMYPRSFDHMLAGWNERNVDHIRDHLVQALTTDVFFVDPTIVTQGLDAFEANVLGFRTKYPDAVLQRTSGIDSHHNLHRYSWDIVVDSKLLLVGFDVAETADDGKIKKILGFFGPLPEVD